MGTADTNKMKNITDKLDCDLYKKKGSIEDFDGNVKREFDQVVVRIYKKGVYEGVGLSLDETMSKKILDSIKD